MSFVANPFVVVLDANVLFPFRIRDVLLTFAQDGKSYIRSSGPHCLFTSGRCWDYPKAMG